MNEPHARSATFEPNRVEHLVEYADSRGTQVKVDEQAGVIAGVKVLGLASKNGRVYRAEAIAEGAALYEGVKVNVNHPKRTVAGPRDYQDRLGCLRNIRATDAGLFGDLHFNPHHAIAEQLAWDARFAPENVGLSHNVQARTSRQGDRTMVEQILSVHSVDLVADPATTHSLFEAAETPSPSASLSAASPLSTDAAIALARDDLRQRRSQLRRWCVEHRLPGPAVTERFLEQLLEVDETTARSLIEERAEFARAVRTESNRPQSRGPMPDAAPTDIRRWAQMVT